MTLHGSCPQARVRIGKSLQDGFPSVYDRFMPVFDGFFRRGPARNLRRINHSAVFDALAHGLKTVKTVKTAKTACRDGGANRLLYG